MLDVREFDDRIEISHGSDLGEPIIYINNAPDRVIAYIGYYRQRIFRLKLFDVEIRHCFISDNNKNKVMIFNEYISKEGKNILVTHSIDKYQYANIYIFDEIKNICVAEISYSDRSNTVNIYRYKDNNREELVSSIIVLDKYWRGDND